MTVNVSGQEKGHGTAGLVSIVIPHYNNGDTIEAAVQSALAQTYTPWEILIVDDHSSADSRDIVRRLAQENEGVSLIELDHNGGTPAIPRNRGIDKASGEFIAFLDADDIWHPQKLSVQLELLEKYQRSLCYSVVYPFRKEDEYDDIIQRITPEEIGYRFMTHRRLLHKNFIRSGSAVLVRAETVGSLRFNEDPTYKAIEDYLFWLSLHQLKISDSLGLAAPLVGYRLSESSLSKSKMFMVGQNYKAYRDYQIDGHPLGLLRYYYFLTYMLISIWNIFSSRLTGRER